MSTTLRKTVFLLVLCSLAACAPAAHAAGREDAAGCVVVYGDSRTNHAAHIQVVEAIARTRPLAVFHVGDMVEDGRDPSQWQKFDEIISLLPLRTPFYPSRGNHESSLEFFARRFSYLPGNKEWYSVDAGGARYIILDTNASLGPSSPQYSWLAEALKGASEQRVFPIVVMHHPVYTSSSYGSPKQELAPLLAPLFSRFGVRLVFSGDVHAYERSFARGTYYVITGGGGAPLKDKVQANQYSQVYKKAYHYCTVCATPEGVRVSAYAPDGAMLDQFTIKPWTNPVNKVE